MLTNNRYLLEKRASDEAEEDNSEIARREYNANRKDSRAYLGSLFNRADEVESQMTSSAGRVLSQKNESGSPFIKVAARLAFDEMIEGGQWVKVASPTYREVAFRSFCNELATLI